MTTDQLNNGIAIGVMTSIVKGLVKSAGRYNEISTSDTDLSIYESVKKCVRDRENR